MEQLNGDRDLRLFCLILNSNSMHFTSLEKLKNSQTCLCAIVCHIGSKNNPRSRGFCLLKSQN